MRHMNFILLMLITCCTLACSKSSDPVPEPPFPPDPEQPQTPSNRVVAHRGAWKEFSLPDNSLAALQKAVEIGVYATECDVMLTKDKKVIVYHDETIGGKYFKDINYAELSAYKLSNNEPIPTLEEFITAIQGYNSTLLWIDIKSLSDQAGGNEWSIECAKTVGELVKSKQAGALVTAIVGRKAVLDASILAAQGNYPNGYMNTAYTPQQFVSAGLTWANFSYDKFYTESNKQPGLIQSYIDNGIKVSVYTVDDEPAMEWYLQQPDVFAITTNYPFLLLQKSK